MREYVGAIVGFVIVAILGVYLLYLGAQGSLPTAFGLFDMSKMSVRIIVTVVLLVVTLGLFMTYNSVRKRSK
jgi:hypothetical protein